MGYLPEREVCHMRRHIDFDKIGITDDVMFCTVLSNSEDCREFLQRILGIEIEEIVAIQSNLNNTANSSGCTWIYSCDELCIIDIEV